MDYQKSAEALKNAEFIFEGYATGQSDRFCIGYYEGDSSRQFASIELTITHCYKGGLKNGTVRMVVPQTYDQHRVGFILNTRLIFLCNKSNYQVSEDFRSFDNSEILQLIHEGYVGRSYPYLSFNFKQDSLTFSVWGLYNVGFTTKAEFHSFLSKSSDKITLPDQTEENQTPPKSPQGELPGSKHLYQDTSGRGDRGFLSPDSVNEIIQYSIRNQRMFTDSGKSYYAFDQ